MKFRKDYSMRLLWRGIDKTWKGLPLERDYHLKGTTTWKDEARDKGEYKTNI